MKLVQLLAKELKEWPESVVVYFQWGSGEVFATSKGVPAEYRGGMWYVVGRDIEMAYDAPMYDKRFDLAEDHDTATVNKSQWQAEREKMNKPKWIRHRGGKCPVKAGTKVVTRYRDGVVSDWCMTRDQDTSEECLSDIWIHSGGETDIMAYYIEETKDQEIEEVKDTNIGTLSITLDANDVFKPMIASMKEMALEWGQIESPLKWRDEIIELEAYEEEFRREREMLIRKLESEGFKLIDHVVPVCGEQIIGMEDYKNWRSGDIVEVTSGTIDGQFTFGKAYVITSIAGSHLEFDCDDSSETNGWNSRNFKFVRRP